MIARKSKHATDRGQYLGMLTALMGVFAVVFAGVTIAGFVCNIMNMQVIGIVGLGISLFLCGRYSKSPDKYTADQTSSMLDLAGRTLYFMQKGLTTESATEVCHLLLPVTCAASVAIFSEDGTLMGHAGAESVWENGEDPLPISGAAMRFEYGAKFAIRSEQTDGHVIPGMLKACIETSLRVQEANKGSLKIYYAEHNDIDETQQAVAMGFGVLLSTQLAMAELEAKTELATKMELKALQAQINPHFLFNTINTIAALIRTDPRQARILLREFAVFYRRTLESSQDLITIELELAQTLRYLGFERARFGAEKIQLSQYVEPGLGQLQVPAFIVQPIVENSVGHAMRPTGEPLRIDITVKRQGDDVVIAVSDDGVGMKSGECDTAVSKGSSKGAGIALKNVNDRLHSCFDVSSGISIKSELGVGTTVFLKLGGAAANIAAQDEEGGVLI